MKYKIIIKIFGIINDILVTTAMKVVDALL